jgi:hypothetical protein
MTPSGRKLGEESPQLIVGLRSRDRGVGNLAQGRLVVHELFATSRGEWFVELAAIDQPVLVTYARHAIMLSTINFCLLVQYVPAVQLII